jgi:hypothetical protein
MARAQTRRGNPEEDIVDGITYDSLGRMQYHPDFHPNHGKPFKLDEIIYICKYHQTDDIRSLSFAVGRTEHTVASKITSLRKDGLYWKYRSMSDDQWERLAK